MTGSRWRYLPVAVVFACASVWGLFWIPLRAFEAAGLAAGWATLAQFVFPLLLLLPLAAHRVLVGRPTGAGDVITGLLIGGSFVLYFDSLLLTEVARSLILFYITPAWSTLLEVVFMRRALTRARILALVLGFSGLLAILGGRSGIPLPQNVGDTMALLSGMVFALGTMRVRQAGEPGVFEHTFSFFLYGAVVAFVITLLPIEAIGRPPEINRLIELLPWLVLMAVGFLIPVVWGILWGSQRMDPGRLGILLQMEAVVGIGSAAVLTDEPFGVPEISGTVLVLGAGVAEVFGSTRPLSQCASEERGNL